jgi:hypothetical protein
MADQATISIQGPESPQKDADRISSEMSTVISDVSKEKSLSIEFQTKELERATENISKTVKSFLQYIAIKAAALAGCTAASTAEKAAGVCILGAEAALAAVTFTGTGQAVGATDVAAGPAPHLHTVGSVSTPGVDNNTSSGNLLRSAAVKLAKCTYALEVATNIHTQTQIAEFAAEIVFLFLSLGLMIEDIIKYIDEIAKRISEIENAEASGNATIESIMGGTIAELRNVAQKFQNKINQIQGANTTTIPISSIEKTLNFETTGASLSTDNSIFNTISTQNIIYTPTNISPTELVIPTTSPISVTTSPISATQGIIVGSSQLILPSDSTLGVLSSSLKICK